MALRQNNRLKQLRPRLRKSLTFAALRYSLNLTGYCSPERINCIESWLDLGRKDESGFYCGYMSSWSYVLTFLHMSRNSSALTIHSRSFYAGNDPDTYEQHTLFNFLCRIYETCSVDISRVIANILFFSKGVSGNMYLTLLVLPPVAACIRRSLWRSFSATFWLVKLMIEVFQTRECHHRERFTNYDNFFEYCFFLLRINNGIILYI